MRNDKVGDVVVGLGDTGLVTVGRTLERAGEDCGRVALVSGAARSDVSERTSRGGAR